MLYKLENGLSDNVRDRQIHTCQPQTKKKQEIFSRGSAATIYVSLPTSHQVLHLYI